MTGNLVLTSSRIWLVEQKEFANLTWQEGNESLLYQKSFDFETFLVNSGLFRIAAIVSLQLHNRCPMRSI